MAGGKMEKFGLILTCQECYGFYTHIRTLDLYYRCKNYGTTDNIYINRTFRDIYHLIKYINTNFLGEPSEDVT